MRIGQTSPWFRASMAREYDAEALRRMEPRTALLSGITDKRNVFHTARLTHGDRHASGTARTAPAALRLALAELYEAERVEVISLLTGPAA